MRKRLNWTVAILAALFALAAVFGWLTRPQYLWQAELPEYSPDPKNGKRLALAGGCTSCHGESLAGGLELETDFGIFRVPNITPDLAHGIGTWGPINFVNAMHFGVSPAGVHYYPAFPYPSYTRMSLTDLLDLKAYLDTVEPVPQANLGHELQVPWNFRRAIGLWKRRYLDPQAVVEIPADDAVLERGRYLVEAVGHCGECHTPRDRFGGPRPQWWLAGAPSLEGDGWVPNITPHPDGLADWSEKDLMRYFTSGFTPDYDTVGGSMAKVQENLAQLPARDLEAIVAYLRALPAVPSRPH